MEISKKINSVEKSTVVYRRVEDSGVEKKIKHYERR